MSPAASDFGKTGYRLRRVKTFTLLQLLKDPQQLANLYSDLTGYYHHPTDIGTKSTP